MPKRDRTTYCLPFKSITSPKSLVECYGPEQAEIHIKCNKYLMEFQGIFPPPGCTGWYAMGVSFDRMKKIAAELEEREAKRCSISG